MDPKTPSTRVPSPLPRGLVLFRSDADPAHRRRRILFLVLFALIGSLVLWPVYPRFSGVFPLVLGLPLSFVWVVMALVAMFFLVLWLFLSEKPTDEGGDL